MSFEILIARFVVGLLVALGIGIIVGFAAGLHVAHKINEDNNDV